MTEQTRTEFRAPMPRGLQLALSVTALLWAVAAAVIAGDAAAGIAIRMQAEILDPLLRSLFFLFLLLVGFRALDSVAAAGAFRADVLRLPRRATRAGEWGTGLALGWGLALALVLPILLSGHLHGRMVWQPGTIVAIVVAVCTLLFATLAQEMVFRGYPFQRLAAAAGESWAAILTSLLFAVMLVYSSPPDHVLLPLLSCFLFGLVLAMACLRTAALWLPWGLHLAYRVTLGVVLGLPVAGHGNSGSVADLSARGPVWLTGGSFGPDGAVLSLLMLLLAMAVLYRASREYAWAYTHRPIVAGGYPVNVPPPPAHAAMEQVAPPPPPLVQIQPATSPAERPREPQG